MFSAIPSDISTAIEAQWAARLKLCSALNAKALETANQLTELNLSTLQQTLARLAPGEKPAAVDPLAYHRQLSRIVFDAGAEYMRLLQPDIAATEQKSAKHIDNLVEATPAPSTGMMDLLRNALGQANSSYHKLIQASEQAVHAMGAAATPAEQPAPAGKPAPAAAKPARKSALDTVKNGKSSGMAG